MREMLAEWRPVVDEAIEEVLPREIDETYVETYFGPATYEYDVQSIQRALADPVWDLLDRGGKRWRAVLFVALVEGFGEDPKEYLRYATIPEILHNGTIIVDDVEDEATMRRGEPALHHEFGEDIALNAGNAMYFLPLRIVSHNPGDLSESTRLRAYEMLMEELSRTHLGQGMDIDWHNHPDGHVDRKEYLEMCACKTGCLGRVVARLAAIVTEQPPEIEAYVAQFAEKASIAFQIADDILDVEHTLGEAGDFGKEFGNDVREGKQTLLVIHAIETAPTNRANRLAALLAAEENTDEEILEAVEILQEANSIEHARETARDLAAKACDDLAMAELEAGVQARLTDFTEYVVERDI
jgi:geranylgeranyl diphosphate synthase type I